MSVESLHDEKNMLICVECSHHTVRESVWIRVRDFHYAWHTSQTARRVVQNFHAMIWPSRLGPMSSVVLPSTLACICHRTNYQTLAGQRVQVHINQGTFNVWFASCMSTSSTFVYWCIILFMYDLRVMVVVVCNLTSLICGHPLSSACPNIELVTSLSLSWL